jgi:trans-aconitate 2-methyltransferase
MGWDPTQYLEFADHRHRPALDLLARVPAVTPRRVVDLGCGHGRLTRLLAERWPDAEVTGIDDSPAMLDRARADDPAGWVRWRLADIGALDLEASPDVVVSNAALHWIPDHDHYFPTLMRQLAPRGVLAVQMPRNHDAPSHTTIAETVADRAWRERLTPLLPGRPVGSPQHYHDLLSPDVAHLDIWETTYLHALTGPDPVLEWTLGSVLRPLLDALEPAEREPFLAAHGARLRAAYPPRYDGVTLFPFRRLFLVAQRA